jgi:exopolysaccharide production protein ExoZ
MLNLAQTPGQGKQALLGIHARLRDFYDPLHGQERVLSMEGARCLAIALVFCVHYNALLSGYLPPSSWSAKVSESAWAIGHSGVDLFFVISGILIYGALLGRKPNYGQFLRRRIVRIYPTFLAVFGLYLLLSILFPERSKIAGPWPVALVYVGENLLLLPGVFSIPPIIVVTWSLSYEFFFYLTLPLLVNLGRMRSWRRWQRVSLLTALLGLIISGLLPLPIRMGMFLVGMLVYEAFQSGWPARLPAVADWAASAILGAVFIAMGWFLQEQDWRRMLAMILGFGLFALSCFGARGYLYRWFSWTPLRWVGNMSYSYYLIHGVTLQGVALLLGHWYHQDGRSTWIFWGVLPLSILATLAASSLLYGLVEKPFSVERRKPKKAILPGQTT